MKRGAVAIVGFGLGVLGAIALIGKRSMGSAGHAVEGGVIMGDVAGYDRMSRRIFGSLFRGIAKDVAKVAPSSGQVLEIGCGPGWLSIRLAGAHRLDVTGIDLDPAMIDRARANAAGTPPDGGSRPRFVTGDVAAMPFPDGSFDVVVSTFSIHHWADQTAGLREIARVLRPGGRALIWDLKPGVLPFHPEIHETHPETSVAGLRPVRAEDWHWPGPLTLARRLELIRDKTTP